MQSEELLSKLAKSSSSRDFLRAAISQSSGSDRKISVSEFSKRAGFKSRSYLNELLAGKKGWSFETFTKVNKCLKLPQQYKRLLYLHVSEEEPDLFLGKRKPKDPSVELIKLKREIRAPESMGSKTRSKAVISHLSNLQVYASLGDSERGATFDEIEKKCGLKVEIIHDSLKTLINNNLVSLKNDKFLAVQSRNDNAKLIPDDGLGDLVAEVLAKISRNSERILNDENSLAFFSAFSMQQGRKKELKLRLQEAVLDVIDEFQDDEGEIVEQIFISSTVSSLMK